MEQHGDRENTIPATMSFGNTLIDRLWLMTFVSRSVGSSPARHETSACDNL
jgi:hypothetical protein